MSKYDLAILAIFKNEESFLPEWLEHYFNRNIDHIYLINDESTDKSVDIILSNKFYDKITLKHTDSFDANLLAEGRQPYLYNKYFSYCLGETRWLGVFDLDEFCYSPETMDIKSLLSEFNSDESIHELIIDWYWFGSNNYIEQPKEIIKSFNKRSDKLSKHVIRALNIQHLGYGASWCCKSFAKTTNISYIKHHYNDFCFNGHEFAYKGPSVERPFSYNLTDKNIMFLNHYLGSHSYFMQNKVKRGSCNRHSIISKNKKIFYEYLNINDVEDNRLYHQNTGRSNEP